MIWTLERFRVPVRLRAERDAAVRAHVLNDADLTVPGARDDDRTIADPRLLEITDVRNLGFKRDVVPRVPAENALLLPGINGGIGIEIVRYGRPRRRLQIHGHSSSADKDQFRLVWLSLENMSNTRLLPH